MAVSGRPGPGRRPRGRVPAAADAVGGTTLRLGAPGVHLNPLDLGPEPDALTRRALFTHTLIPVLLGEPLTGRPVRCWTGR